MDKWEKVSSGGYRERARWISREIIECVVKVPGNVDIEFCDASSLR